MTRLRLRWRRYAYIARKYWRMNPFRLWWVLHLWDEVMADLRRGAGEGDRGEVFRDGIRTGRRSAATELDSIAADAIHPDDSNDRIAALLEIRRAARRVGGLDPLPAGDADV